MALPSVNEIVVPVANLNMTIQYKNTNLIGDRVFPILPLASPASKILKYGKANMFRDENQTLYRAEGGETKIFDWDVNSQTVTPQQISAGESVPVEMIDIEQMPGQLPTNSIIDAVQHGVARIENFKERAIANLIYTTAWLDGTAGGSVPAGGNGGWVRNDSSNSFVQDIYNAKTSIVKSTGVTPNVLVMDYQTFNAQQFANPLIADKIKYTQRAVETSALIADLLELDEVIVGKSVYTSQAENKKNPNPSMNFIWNPSGYGQAFLFHREAPGLRSLTAGLQVRLPYRGSMRYVEGYYDYRKRSYVYTITEQVEFVPIATDVAWAFNRTNS
jgi:hypothetical protein